MRSGRHRRRQPCRVPAGGLAAPGRVRRRRHADRRRAGAALSAAAAVEGLSRRQDRPRPAADAAGGVLSRPPHRVPARDPGRRDRPRRPRPCGSHPASVSGTAISCSPPARATGCRRSPASSSTACAICATWPRPTTLRERLAAAEHVVVIGAGFIGLEFAAVARAHGKPVHIVELTDRVMGRVASRRRPRISSPRRIAAPGSSSALARRSARIGGRQRPGRPCRTGRRRAAAGRPRRSSASASCRTANWRRRRGSRWRTASSSTSSC